LLAALNDVKVVFLEQAGGAFKIGGMSGIVDGFVQKVVFFKP